MITANCNSKPYRNCEPSMVCYDGHRNRFSSKESPCNTRSSGSYKRTLDFSCPKKQSHVNCGDRFIPNRARTNMNQVMFSGDNKRLDSTNVNRDGHNCVVPEEQREAYQAALRSTLLGDDGRVLAFSESAPKPTQGHKILYSTLDQAYRRKGFPLRRLPNGPSSVLDAPGLMDDYYLNLISWSDTNVIAVGLEKSVYLWNASDGAICELCYIGGDSSSHVTSVTWIQKGGKVLAVGSTTGGVQIWNVETKQLLRTLKGHDSRVSALSWYNHVVSSGCRDGIIINHDVRMANHEIATLKQHTKEVCQLAWSPDGSTLASGGNDDKVCIWDVNAKSSSQPRFQFTDHKAAVKALAWSPHESNLLATGGGTEDRCIKFWNTQSGNLLNSIDTLSQVCSLKWNPHAREILSSHGYGTSGSNSLRLWKYPTMTLVKEFDNHARGLHVATSPDGGTICVGSADESMRFWDIFSVPKAVSGVAGNYSKALKGDLPLSDVFWKGMQIR